MPFSRRRGTDRMAILEAEADSSHPIRAERDMPAGFADDELGGSNINGSTGPQAEHAIEASRRHLAEGYRDRTEHPQAVGLARKRFHHRQRHVGIGRFQSDHFEIPSRSPLRRLEDKPFPIEPSAFAASSGELFIGAEIVNETELDIAHLFA